MAVPQVGVVGVLLLATAAAADPAAPTPAPPERSWYGAAAPAPAPEVERQVRHIIQRGGVFLLAGGTYLDGAMNGRFDLGLPAPIDRAPRLRLIVMLEGTFETQPMMIERRTLAVTPAAQYEWHLPFEMKSGELVLIASAGLRRATLWIRRPDAPFYPSTWESDDTWALRATAGIEYRGPSGLVVSLQPLSVIAPFTEPAPPDPRWMEPKPATTIAASLVAGYQFQ